MAVDEHPHSGAGVILTRPGAGAAFLVLLLGALQGGRIFAAPAPGLHVASGEILPARAQRLQLQATVEDNYPHFQVTHSQGISNRLETRLHGLFRHAKVTGLGNEYRYDSDHLEAGLRMRLVKGGRRDIALIPAGGYSRVSERHVYSDGRRAASASRYYWAEISAAKSLDPGLTLTAVARGIREIDNHTETTAGIFSLELPPVNRMLLVGDMAVFIDNPLGWRAPWAAGMRMRHEKHDLYLYLSNTWGTTMPASLAGTDLLFYNLRIALNM